MCRSIAFSQFSTHEEQPNDSEKLKTSGMTCGDMKHTSSLLALIALTTPLQAVVLSGGPDAWSRGDAQTAHFGWDIFEASGTPGRFGDRQLNDSSPDIGTALSASTIFQNDSNAYGHRSSSSNIYSGFQGDALDISIRFPGIGTANVGMTTILLTVLGNPADSNVLTPFILSSTSDSALSLSPTVSLTDQSAEYPDKKVWVAEWQVPGSDPQDYEIRILSDLASGNGTDVALDSLVVDVAWTNAPAALSNSHSFSSLGNITTVPEPTTGVLALSSLAMLTFTRRRKVASK